MAQQPRHSEDGVGHDDPPRGSESDRGNVEPKVADAPAVEHGSRTIQGANGPIVIEEDSGVAAADIERPG